MLKDELELKLQSNVYFRLNQIENSISAIEKSLSRIEKKINLNHFQIKSNLIQFQITKATSINSLIFDHNYIDLSPAKTKEMIESDTPVIILDICQDATDHQGLFKGESYFHIPFSSLKENYNLVPSKSTPLLVFSEDGVNSIQACNLLYKKGFYSIFNVSGGFQYFKK